MRRLTVAIDGPAAAGKSTAARGLALRLGYTYLDTGGLYRALAYLYLTRENLDGPVDHAVLAEVLHGFEARPLSSGGFSVGGHNLGDELRTPEVGSAASKLAVIREVRDALTAQARKLAEGGGVVMEGRDAGTVILPDADLKFFLTASLEERSRRRFEELRERGERVTFEEVMAAEKARDERDSNRSLAPLRPAPDAVVLDTTGLTPEQVLEAIWREAARRFDIAETGPRSE